VVFALAQHLKLSPSVTVNGDDLLVLGGPWAMDGAGLVCVMLAVSGSSLTYRYIEEPARRFFNQLSSPDSPRSARPETAAQHPSVAHI
jgi:peptidoglycan/LPS O-acetylase OafA/YrhL